MKKRLGLSIIVALSLILVLSDQYLTQSYGLSLFEYMDTLQAYNEMEQAYLHDLSIIRYGADSNSPPLRYVDTETQQYKGIVIDYLDALSIELGTSIEFIPMLWRNALKDLSDGQIDICDMHPSDERGQFFDFTAPIYYQKGVILTYKDSPIQQEENLENQKVAANDGDYIFEYLENHHPTTKVVAAKDLEAAITMLRLGEVDAVLGDESVIRYFIDKENLEHQFYIAEGSLYEQAACIAVKNGNTELLTIINKGIAKLKTKNTMDKIYQKWYGSQPLITKDTQVFKWQFILQLLIILSGFSFLVFYYWNRELSQQVSRRTNDLHVTNKMLATTFNGLTQFLVVLNHNRQVVQANNSYLTFAGLTTKDVIGQSIEKLGNLFENKRLNNKIDQAYSNGKPITCLFNDQYRTYKVDGYPLDGPQQTFALLLLLKDITDDQLQQKQLLQSRKMAAVGQLAAGVAHEIRNPMGLIRNHTFLLKRQLQAQMNNDIHESMTIMDQSIERVNSIINNLLNFSRDEQLQATSVELKPFIEDILALNKKNIDTYKTQITLICPRGFRAILFVESMKHILLNLLTNSLAAIGTNGHILIEIEPETSGFRLLFTDNGHGIPVHILQNIFHPFFTTKPPDKGTGLGLYIVYNEIQKIGGHISVDSTENIGTTFNVYVPTSQGERSSETNEFHKL